MNNYEATSRYHEHLKYIEKRGQAYGSFWTAYILEYGLYVDIEWLDYEEFAVEGVEIFFNEANFNKRYRELIDLGYECRYYHGTVSKGSKLNYY